VTARVLDLLRKITAAAVLCLGLMAGTNAGWTASVPPGLGGHVKLRGQLSRPAENTWQDMADANTLWDGAAEVRIKYQADLTADLDATIHYENMLAGGDTCQWKTTLLDRFPFLSDRDWRLEGDMPEDDRRLLDLTRRLDRDNDWIWYHRLDRLCLSWRPGPVDIRLGRQAVTWGNGRIFNPMDLCNPFSPTDVERDYKIGDDMLSAEITGAFGHVQLLVVPRRDPADHDVDAAHSSAAVKYHLAAGGLEWNLMAGRHYRDLVAGAGVVGYLGGAAWRLDTVLTVPDDDDDLWTENKEADTYLAVVANIDRSWVWWKRNWYGLVEFHYNGLMDDDYAENTTVGYIADRLARGDLHGLGRYYAAATIQLEAHPLVNLYLTAIANLEDPSGVFLPRLTWDATANARLTLGGTLNRGGTGTEFGGWEIPRSAFLPAGLPGHATGLYTTPPDSIYAWLTWYF